jgi:hypothetical protein
MQEPGVNHLHCIDRRQGVFKMKRLLAGMVLAAVIGLGLVAISAISPVATTALAQNRIMSPWTGYCPDGRWFRDVRKCPKVPNHTRPVRRYF